MVKCELYDIYSYYAAGQVDPSTFTPKGCAGEGSTLVNGREYWAFTYMPITEKEECDALMSLLGTSPEYYQWSSNNFCRKCTSSSPHEGQPNSCTGHWCLMDLPVPRCKEDQKSTTANPCNDK